MHICVFSGVGLNEWAVTFILVMHICVFSFWFLIHTFLNCALQVTHPDFKKAKEKVMFKKKEGVPEGLYMWKKIILHVKTALYYVCILDLKYIFILIYALGFRYIFLFKWSSILERSKTLILSSTNCRLCLSNTTEFKHSRLSISNR